MQDQTADTLTTRTVAALSRRGSLLGIGGIAIAAALSRPGPARAGKTGKKAKKACKRQIGKCEASMTALCAGGRLASTQEECQTALLPCCQSFKGCKAGDALLCLQAGLASLLPPPPR